MSRQPIRPKTPRGPSLSCSLIGTISNTFPSSFLITERQLLLPSQLFRQRSLAGAPLGQLRSNGGPIMNKKQLAITLPLAELTR